MTFSALKNAGLGILSWSQLTLSVLIEAVVVLCVVVVEVGTTVVAVVVMTAGVCASEVAA